MAKVRVHELAKELGVESKELLAHLKAQGEFVKSASSTIEAPVVRKIKENPPKPTKAGGDAADVPSSSPKPAGGSSAKPGAPKPGPKAPAPKAAPADAAPAAPSKPAERTSGTSPAPPVASAPTPVPSAGRPCAGAASGPCVRCADTCPRTGRTPRATVAPTPCSPWPTVR